MLTFDILQNFLKEAKSTYDCWQDIELYNENYRALNEENANQIITQLQKSINRYGQSIQELSGLTNVSIVKYESLNIVHAFNSLLYITQNIPTYVAYEQLKEQNLERILKLLLGNN